MAQRRRRQDVIKAEIEAATAEGDVVRRQGRAEIRRGAAQCSDWAPVPVSLAAPTGFGLPGDSLAQVQALARSANPMRRWPEHRAIPRPKPNLLPISTTTPT